MGVLDSIESAFLRAKWIDTLAAIVSGPMGCGGSNGYLHVAASPPPPSPGSASPAKSPNTLTEQEEKEASSFIANADTICRDFTKRLLHNDMNSNSAQIRLLNDFCLSDCRDFLIKYHTPDEVDKCRCANDSVVDTRQKYFDCQEHAANNRYGK